LGGWGGKEGEVCVKNMPANCLVFVQILISSLEGGGTGARHVSKYFWQFSEVPERRRP